MELQRQLHEGKIINIFSDENIRMFGIMYTNFRQRTLNLYGNIDRKKLKDLYWIFTFQRLLPVTYCLKLIYSYSLQECWYSKIVLNQQNNKYELTNEGKVYNIKHVNEWFNKILNPSLSDTERNHVLNFTVENIF
jgi:hypothetical protein